MKTLFTLLALTLAGCIAGPSPVDYCSLAPDDDHVVLDSVALNGSVASRTFTFGPTSCNALTSAYDMMVLDFDYRYKTSGNVLLTCTTGMAAATATRTPQTCSGPGTCVGNDAGIISKAATAHKKYAARMGISGYRAWSCVASHDATPTANDRLTLRAYLSP